MGHLITAPQVRVNFYTQDGTFSVSGQFPNTEKADQLISVETNKDLRQAAGTFSVTLTAATFTRQQSVNLPRSEAQAQAGIEGDPVIRSSRTGYGWKDVLKPGDLVVIEMGPDRPQPADTYYQQNFTKGLSGTTEVVMIGSIDDITTTTSIGSDGRPARAVVVTGRDFGKYLVDDQIQRDPWWNSLDSFIRFRDGLLEFPRVGLPGLPANIVKLVFDLWIFKLFDVRFDLNSPHESLPEKERRLSNILRYSLDAGTPIVPYLSSWIDFEGSPWALFEEITGNPWYVMHLDTRRRQDVDAILKYTGGRTIDNQATTVWNTATSHWDHQVFLTYYRNPHSNRFYDDFTSLPTRVITPDDVISEQLSVSLEEVFTRWRALPNAPGLNNKRVIVSQEVERDLSLEDRFGFRPRLLNSPFLQDMQDASGVELAKKLTKQIRDWDILNLYFLSGSYTIKGMAQLRVGDRLHYQTGDKRGVDFFVEGVGQDFRAFSGWTTSLAVTRGQTHRERREPLFDSDGGIAFHEVYAMDKVGR